MFFLRIKPHYLFICSKIVAYWWGFTYNDVVPECYIITMDGLESEPFADVAPYIFEDLGRAYAVVKKQYRNTDLKKHVIGLNLVEIHSLDSVYQKFTWPMWGCMESMHNGAILIKKARLIKQKCYLCIVNINNGHLSMSLINHRRRSARWHGASLKVGQSAAPLFLDRIDIQCEITPVPFKDISKAAPGEPSANIRERVIKAREIQAARYKDYKGIHCNAQMTERMIHQFAEPNEAGIDMLRMAMEKLSLSARAYSRILKVARTIADLEGCEHVELHHLAEAIGYRALDRGDWAERGHI